MRFSITDVCRSTALVLCTVQVSSAYWLDSSCTNGKFIAPDKLEGAINDAFELAKNAVENWDKKDRKDLQTWIFGNYVDTARGFFDNVYGGGKSRVVNKQTTQDEITFICELDNFEFDTSTDPDNPSGIVTSWEKSNLRGFKAKNNLTDTCVTPSSSGTRTMAFTVRPGAGSFIVICPWYLQKFNTAPVPTKSSFLATVSKKVGKLAKKFDPIGTFALLETTILHEVMHTKYGGYAEDVEEEKSYGWGNIRRLSSSASGAFNADSLAYYGLASDLIGQKYKVDQDGVVSSGVL